MASKGRGWGVGDTKHTVRIVGMIGRYKTMAVILGRHNKGGHMKKVWKVLVYKIP